MALSMRPSGTMLFLPLVVIVVAIWRSRAGPRSSLSLMELQYTSRLVRRQPSFDFSSSLRLTSVRRQYVSQANLPQLVGLFVSQLAPALMLAERDWASREEHKKIKK